jgi:ATP-binding cassette, subfamily F, member 2
LLLLYLIHSFIAER